MVSNSTSFSDVTSKCALSTVSVTNASCDLNSNKKSYSSLSCSDTTSKSFLSTVSQRNTLYNVNCSDKSYSSNCSRVFSKPIIADIKYSSFKTEAPLPLEDGVLSYGPVDGSCN